MEATDDMPVVGTLAELTALVERERGLYVRWSRGRRSTCTPCPASTT